MSMTASKSTRRIKRTVVGLCVVLVFALFGTLIWAKTDRNMIWYVSPSIDPQGHKVHLLCPRGWKPVEEGYKLSWKEVDGDKQIELMSNDDDAPAVSIVQEWLIKLRLATRQERITGTVQLIVGRDVNASWGQKPGVQGPDGKLRYPAGNADSLACANRAIAISGSELQAGVMYYGGTGNIGGDPIEVVMCNSMYVE